MKDEYTLWKTWWYMQMYGASPETRMKQMDSLRNQ
jgi:hypothetical protein